MSSVALRMARCAAVNKQIIASPGLPRLIWETRRIAPSDKRSTGASRRHLGFLAAFLLVGFVCRPSLSSCFGRQSSSTRGRSPSSPSPSSLTSEARSSPRPLRRTGSRTSSSPRTRPAIAPPTRRAQPPTQRPSRPLVAALTDADCSASSCRRDRPIPSRSTWARASSSSTARCLGSATRHASGVQSALRTSPPSVSRA